MGRGVVISGRLLHQLAALCAQSLLQPAPDRVSDVVPDSLFDGRVDDMVELEDSER